MGWTKAFSGYLLVVSVFIIIYTMISTIRYKKYETEEEKWGTFVKYTILICIISLTMDIVGFMTNQSIFQLIICSIHIFLLVISVLVSVFKIRKIKEIGKHGK